MKASVKLALPGFTGKMDDMVIYYNSTLNKLIARRYVMPTHVPSNDDFVAISKLVRNLRISEEYINDCRRYVKLYNQKYRRHNRALSSWNNVFFRLMMKLKKQFPELDLTTLTKDEIYANDYPCISIKRAVEAQLLDPLSDYALLDHGL